MNAEETSMDMQSVKYLRLLVLKIRAELQNVDSLRTDQISDCAETEWYAWPEDNLFSAEEKAHKHVQLI